MSPVSKASIAPSLTTAIMRLRYSLFYRGNEKFVIAPQLIWPSPVLNSGFLLDGQTFHILGLFAIGLISF